MTHTRLTSCPLCERLLAEAGAAPLPAFSRDHLVRCGACGFIFSILVPSAEDYARVYGSYDYSSEEDARTDFNKQREAAVVESLMPYKVTGNVVDIAAGAGRFLEHFKDRGFTCYATEFDARLEELLLRKGFHVLPGGTTPEAGETRFDIVVFTEIIEHINNPMVVLRSLWRLLRPGGCIYVTTPNFNSLERRLLGADWGMICWPEHITYWTPRTLDQAMRRAGFQRRWRTVENISPYRVLQALKRGPLSRVVGDVSEQDFSDKAQQQVAGSRLLSLAKRAVNLGLHASRLGSSIKAVYEKPRR
jgi:2-polyprenyl-3-methyl-5-hydroxy-6-metoxy-1,4-benzoquinol methylase